MHYDVILQNSHRISPQCKKYKEKYKIFVCENIELNKSNESLKKKILTMEESLGYVNKTEESFIVDKLRKEVFCLTLGIF